MRMNIDSCIRDADIIIYDYPMKDAMIEKGKDNDKGKREWKFIIRSDRYGWTCRGPISASSDFGDFVCGGKPNTRMPTMLGKSIKALDALWMERNEEK